MDALWDPLTALFEVVGDGFDLVFAFMASLASVFALSTGLVTLFFGRKLFWVFIGAAGFILGLNIAPVVIDLLPSALAPFEWLFMLVIALSVGALCIVLQRIAAVLAGALVIGVLAFLVAGAYGLNDVLQWVMAVGFGLSGALLLFFFFDWTLILVTGPVGAAVALLGARAFADMPEAVHLWAFVILTVMGIWYQVRDMQSENARARAAAAGTAPASAPVRSPGKAGKGAPAGAAPAKATPAPAPGTPAAQQAWPAAAQRPATPRPPAPAAEPRPYQTSPQAWG